MIPRIPGNAEFWLLRRDNPPLQESVGIHDSGSWSGPKRTVRETLSVRGCSPEFINHVTYISRQIRIARWAQNITKTLSSGSDSPFTSFVYWTQSSHQTTASHFPAQIHVNFFKICHTKIQYTSRIRLFIFTLKTNRNASEWNVLHCRKFDPEFYHFTY